MGISVTTSNPLYFASLFGVDPSVIEKAGSVGASIVQNSIGFLTIMCNGKKYGEVTVKGSAISLAKSGQLGPASKAVIKHQLEQLLVKAINDSAPGEAPAAPTAKPDTTGMTPGQKAAITKMLKAGKDPGDMPVSNDVASVTDTKVQKATGNETPIKLANATKLLQPVKGTSESSTYYTVACLKGLNVAIRRTKSKLSIRAEGNGLNDYAGPLLSMGMPIKGDYASQHYEVLTPEMTRKTVGALLGVLGPGNWLATIDPLNVSQKT